MAKNDDEDIFTEDPEPQAPASGDSAVERLLSQQAETNTRLVTALETLTKRSEAGPTPQIPITQYKAKTPWNPTGRRYKVKLSRPTWMNGNKLRDIMLPETTIGKLNQLQPGIYRNGKWIVEAIGATEGNLPGISIRIPNKTVEQRIELATLVRTLEDIVDLMITEKGPALAS